MHGTEHAMTGCPLVKTPRTLDEGETVSETSTKHAGLSVSAQIEQPTSACSTAGSSVRPGSVRSKLSMVTGYQTGYVCSFHYTTLERVGERFSVIVVCSYCLPLSTYK